LRELERFEIAIERASEFGDDSRLVKRLENAKVRAEERLRRMIESIKDPGITFEPPAIRTPGRCWPTGGTRIWSRPAGRTCFGWPAR
jgi:hypothetical protein